MDIPLSTRHPVPWSARLAAEEVLQQVRGHAADLEAQLAAEPLDEADADAAAAREALRQAMATAVDRAERQVAAAASSVAYRIRVPTRADRAALRRAVRAAGCHWPDDAELAATLRAGVAAAIEDSELRDRLLAALDRLAAARAAGEDADPDDVAVEAEVAGRMRRAWPRYASLVADRAHYQEIAPATAVAMFVLGEERPGHPAVTYPRTADDRLPDAVLDRIEARGDLAALGYHIPTRLMALPEADERD